MVTVSATAGTLTKVKLSYTNKDRQGRTQHGVGLRDDEQRPYEVDRERAT